jgi:Predicted Fe-S oxidoreductases
LNKGENNVSAGDDKTIKKSLNLDMLKNVLRDAADLGAKKLDISGGDPINYKYLPELIKESLELGYRDITISTKGISVTSEVAKRLRLAGLDRIQMSIDTMNPELYDSVVGSKGMFERMIRGWYNLRKEGFMIVNRATITNRTVSGVIELLKKNYSMGISNVRAVGVLHFGRGTNDMMPAPG